MLVGITTTFDKNGGNDEFERVNSVYIECVTSAGGTPVLLSPVPGGDGANANAARDIVGAVDALVLSGGGDIDPVRYGDTVRLPDTVHVSEARDALEIALVRLAHENDLPILGTCRGMQVMNVARGGTLWQDLSVNGLTAERHWQQPPYQMAHQRIDVVQGTLLDQALRNGRVVVGWRVERETTTRPRMVNTMHHQAIAALAPGLAVSATSEDGIVEGIEDTTRRFFVGVQWHPEYLEDNAPLFEALVKATAER